MITVLLIAAGLAWLMAMWPFGPYQLSLLAIRRLRGALPAPRKVGSPPASYALCLCVHNERSCIEAKIADMLRMADEAEGRLEILVYVDGANDGTPEILREHEDRIRLFVSAENQGKTEGMNLLARNTDAEILIYTDANVLAGERPIAVLDRYFADREIGCVCSDLTYVNPGDSATAEVGSAYWRLNEWSKALETDTGSVMGADGALYAIRRALHEEVPDGLIDDLFISLSVLIAGGRVVRAPELRAFETHAIDAKDEFSRKIRIACECMHIHFRLWPRLRKLDGLHLYKYIAHRLARWMCGVCLLAGGVFAASAITAMIGPLVTLAIGTAGLSVVAIGVVSRNRIVLAAWNALLAIVGTTVGVWRAFRGRRAITWSIAASSRRVPSVARAAP